MEGEESRQHGAKFSRLPIWGSRPGQHRITGTHWLWLCKRSSSLRFGGCSGHCSLVMDVKGKFIVKLQCPIVLRVFFWKPCAFGLLSRHTNISQSTVWWS